jgi:hypothetical protein
MADKGTKIARALGRSYDKLRTIFLKGECLRLYDVTTGPWTVPPIATYDSHWYLDRREYSELTTGKRYLLLKVADVDGCRLEKLRAMTAARVGDTVFKVVSKGNFIGSVPAWEIRLSPTGERV